MGWSGIELVLHSERPATICLRHGTVSHGLKILKLTAVETDKITLQYFEVFFQFFFLLFFIIKTPWP